MLFFPLFVVRVLTDGGRKCRQGLLLSVEGHICYFEGRVFFIFKLKKSLKPPLNASFRLQATCTVLEAAMETQYYSRVSLS